MEHTLRQMFKQAIEIEQMAAEIYKEFEFRFSHIPEAVELWRAMALDEIRHEEILYETFLSLPNPELNKNPGDLMWQYLANTKTMFKTQTGCTVKTLGDALEAAHRLESSEINSIFKFLALDCFSMPIRGAFIESEIMDHHKKLTDFSSKYGRNC